jgi:hypothetical protein
VVRVRQGHLKASTFWDVSLLDSSGRETWLTRLYAEAQGRSLAERIAATINRPLELAAGRQPSPVVRSLCHRKVEPDMSNQTASPATETQLQRKRRLWLWFTFGFAFVFLVMALAWPMHFYDGSELIRSTAQEQNHGSDRRA